MEERYFAAVIGGATAGSEVTAQLTKAGVEVVIFEQNPLPYGKIEDGLPRWHTKLRDREYGKIDEKLSHDLVHYVPQHKLGVDFSIQDLQDQGFSIIILANGAWKDRPMKAEGLEEIKDNSFCYQNSFIYWFNHCEDRDYSGEVYPIKEGAMIIGGGLASIDVIKVCQLELTCKRLKEMGIEADVLTLESKGIDKFLEENNLKWEDLKLRPTRLFYRRRILDIPLASAPEGATEERLQKVYEVRQKIIDNAQKKFFFEVYPLHLPKKVHHKDGTLSGITFSRTKIEGGKVIVLDEEEYLDGDFCVSSIGSIPEPLSGISMKGELYDLVNEETGQFKDAPNIFGVGNAITGKGNIQVSMKHGRYIGQMIAGSLDATGPDYEELLEGKEETVRENMVKVREYLSSLPKIGGEGREKILSYVKKCQESRGFDGNLEEWKKKILSTR